jgi:hypothetical protein
MYARVSSALVIVLSRISCAALATPCWVRSAGRWAMVAHPAATTARVRVAVAARMFMIFLLTGLVNVGR